MGAAAFALTDTLETAADLASRSGGKQELVQLLRGVEGKEHPVLINDDIRHSMNAYRVGDTLGINRFYMLGFHFCLVSKFSNQFFFSFVQYSLP